MRVAALLLLLSVAGCASMRPDAPPNFKQEFVIHGSRLTLHLTPGTRGDGPLIVYATGDGGFRDHDKRIFLRLAKWGYPIAGIGAPQYVDGLAEGEVAPSPADIADDFATIVSKAETVLGLPRTTPVVFVGVSRGAGLAVAAGYASHLHGHLLGILAVALTHEEENAVAPPLDAAADAPPEPLDVYAALSSLGATRVAVIQSTHDEYVPADQARELFGPDTESRRLRAIEAANHSFDGATSELDREMKRSFQWIVRRL
ncbi:MAG TPA: AcvB/VirJ family lysyl-phosphatidylglycerol hydrolase [Candidatus Binatia bacterium]|jgi:fermentation-respiration switch protein FrsA (DUF1100 family)